MGGLRLITYHLTKLWSNLLALLVILSGAAVGLAQSSQEENDVRVDFAGQYQDNKVIVQVSIPRGKTIENAVLQVGDVQVTLDLIPEGLPVQQWFVLDASGSMVNLAPLIANALEKFLQGQSGIEIGVITYNDRLHILNPTRQISEVISFLELYAAVPGSRGCVGNALAALQQGVSPAIARRTLLIAGPLSSQSACTMDPIQQLPVPLDMIIIADEVDPVYTDLAAIHSGELKRANRQTIPTRLNEIHSLWAHQTYQLEGTLPFSATRAELQVTLSGGEISTLSVKLMALEESPQQEAALHPVATSGLQVVETLSPTAIASSTISAAVPTISPSMSAEISALSATENPSPVNATSNLAAPISPTQSPATADNSIEQSESKATKPDSVNTNDKTKLNLLPGIVGGVIVLAAGLVVGIIAIGRQRKGPSGQNKQPGKEKSSREVENETIIYRSKSSPGSRPVDAVESTRLLQEEASLSVEDQLLVTEMLSDADYLEMQSKSLPDVVGWLRLEAAGARIIPLYRSGLLIGRNSTCDLVIQDKAVSTQHVRVEVREDNSVWATVVSQTNPIFIRGQRILSGQSQLLQPQDVMSLSPKTRIAYIKRDDSAPYQLATPKSPNDLDYTEI